MSAEDEARLRYQQLVNEYGAALAAKDSRSQELLVRATVAWEELRAFPGPESELASDVHLVTSMQFAIEADDAKEGRRLYDAMSADFQAMIGGDAKNAMLMAWLASGAEPDTMN